MTRNQTWTAMHAWIAALIVATSCVRTTGTTGLQATDSATDGTVAADASDSVSADAALDDSSATDAAAFADATTGDAALSGIVTNFDAFCTAWAGTICQRSAACGCALPNGQSYASACPTAAAALCHDEFAKAEAMARANLVAVDLAKIPACLAAIDARLPLCIWPDKDAMEIPECYVAFVNAPKAPSCSSSLLCADGTRCSKGSCGGAQAAVGAPCEDPAGCVTWTCTDTGLCAPFPTVGSPCGDGIDCPYGLWCQQGVCAGAIAAGLPCSESGACDLGLLCSGGVCAKPKGTACTDDADCGNGASCLPTSPPACQAHVCAALWGQ